MLRVKRKEEGRAINDIIAPNIRKIIKEKGLKQCAVAEKAGYSPRQISAMLNGRRLILDIDVCKIAEALDVDANTLLRREKVID